MITTSKTTRLSVTKRSTRFGRAISVLLSIATWAILILAVLVTTLLVWWVLLSIIFLGRGPSLSVTPVPVKLIALLALTSCLAWLIARYLASWRRVGQSVGLIVELFTLFELVMIALGQTAATWMGIVLLLILGVGNGFLTITVITPIKHRTPQELFGRIMSLVMLANLSLLPFSQVVSGAKWHWNVSILMAAGGVGILLLAVWFISQSGLELMAIPLADGVSPLPGSQNKEISYKRRKNG